MYANNTLECKYNSILSIASDILKFIARLVYYSLPYYFTKTAGSLDTLTKIISFASVYL